jgi:hypothetical protein
MEKKRKNTSKTPNSQNSCKLKEKRKKEKE